MSGTRMSSKPKKDAAREPAPLSFAKRDPDAAADRIPLFEVDGVEYTIPAVIPTGEALMHLATTRGMQDEAMRGMYLLREIAGPAAFNALLGEAEMTPKDWHQLTTVLTEHTFGPLEKPGN